MVFDMQEYVYSESVFNTLYTKIKQKYYLDKINGTKYALFSLL